MNYSSTSFPTRPFIPTSSPFSQISYSSINTFYAWSSEREARIHRTCLLSRLKSSSRGRGVPQMTQWQVCRASIKSSMLRSQSLLSWLFFWYSTMMVAGCKSKITWMASSHILMSWLVTRIFFIGGSFFKLEPSRIQAFSFISGGHLVLYERGTFSGKIAQIYSSVTTLKSLISWCNWWWGSPTNNTGFFLFLMVWRADMQLGMTSMLSKLSSSAMRSLWSLRVWANLLVRMNLQL